MKLLILQLGDIHLRGSADAILAKANQIAEAAISRTDGAQALILAVCGDVAYSGQEDEYLAALDFFDSITRLIKPRLEGPSAVYNVAIPGNHDVQHEGPAGARSIICEAFRSRSEGSLDSSSRDVCTAPQAKFFDFRAALDVSCPPEGDTVYYEYNLPILGQEIVRIRCCNSAVASMKHEQPSTLYYPWMRVAENAGVPTLDICLVHHPYNWFTPHVGRELRNAIEARCDVIFTGHEHRFSASTRSGWSGETNLYIEGGALQGHSGDDGESTFNVVTVDTAVRQHKLTNFQWNGELYEGRDKGWEPYHVNQLRLAHQLQPNASHAKWLNDPEISLEHTTRGLVTLDDIFVYPDLQPVTFPVRRQSPPPVRSDRLLARASELGALYVSGPEKSGKTCLAKRLFKDALADGLVPVYLKGQPLTVKKQEQVADHITREFGRQYEAGKKERFLQLDRGKRLLIVDDIHKATGVDGSISALIESLLQFAGQVIVIGTTLAQQVREVVAPELSVGVGGRLTHLRILPFGHAKKYELVSKWCTLDSSLQHNPEALAFKIMQRKRLLDTAVMNNVMPSYPLFMLPLLQAHDAGDQVDLRASTYGYFYELLIRRALATQSTKESFDVKINYLAFVAFRMFSDSVKELQDSAIRDLHQQFEGQQLIDLPFVPFMTELARGEVLVNDGARYWFPYPYIYYYFVASYLRDRMSEPSVRDIVSTLARDLSNEEAANILLFLAHLSKDPLISDVLLGVARNTFPTRERASLAPDQRVVDLLEDALQEATFEDYGSDGPRLLMESMDRAEAPVALSDEASRALDQRSFDEAQHKIDELATAFKVLQILGQVVKNFPGSLTGEVKKSIVGECYGLGLRTLAEVFSLVEEDPDGFVTHLAATIRGVEGKFEGERLAQKTRDSAYGLIHLLAYGMIRRIAVAVGASELAKVYDLLARESNTPATALITAALELDMSERYPSDAMADLYHALDRNPLAQSVLRGLAVNYFHVIQTRFHIKQKACAQLEINYRALRPGDVTDGGRRE